MRTRRWIVLGVHADALLLAVAGAALAVAGTLGLFGAGTLGLFGAGTLVLIAGLALLGSAVAVGALARHLADETASAVAIAVLGFTWLHLLGLAVAVIAGVAAVLVGGDPVTAGVWGVGSAAFLATSYAWDRLSETDVDAALAEASWHPQE